DVAHPGTDNPRSGHYAIVIDNAMSFLTRSSLGLTFLLCLAAPACGGDDGAAPNTGGAAGHPSTHDASAGTGGMGGGEVDGGAAGSTDGGQLEEGAAAGSAGSAIDAESGAAGAAGSPSPTDAGEVDAGPSNAVVPIDWPAFPAKAPQDAPTDLLRKILL